MEGSFLRDIKEKADAKKERRINWVLEDFNIRTVLTAHPLILSSVLVLELLPT
jgi:phosphoenolpyruvate carboxylase